MGVEGDVITSRRERLAVGLKVEGDVHHRFFSRKGRGRAKCGGSENQRTKHESHWCFLLTEMDTSDPYARLSLNARLIVVKFARRILTHTCRVLFRSWLKGRKT